MPSGKKAAVQQGLDELKLKYLTVDRNYETLKTLTRRGNELMDLERVSDLYTIHF